MAKLIDGKTISKQIKDELKEEAAKLKEQGITACLAVIQVGKDPASCVYVNKRKHVLMWGLSPELMNWKNPSQNRN